MDNYLILILLFSWLTFDCDAQPTVKSDITSPYCSSRVDGGVMTKMAEITQEIQKLHQDLQTEKKERVLLQQKFEKESQRLEAYTSRKTLVSTIFKYTVENLVYGNNFEETLDVQISQTFFVNIMKRAAEMNPIYNFTTSEHPRYGEYVTSINGLAANNDAHLYWALIRRFDINNEDCLINVGISFYIPEASEHVVFQYRSWDNPVPGCDGPHLK